MELDETKYARYIEVFHQHMTEITSELGRAVIGQQKVIRQILSCLFARGHTLLVGVPGLAKTLLARALGELLDLSFKRIQFTPDLMPSDITGTNVLHETAAGREFRFLPGPIFANLILADEINRTPPKTQAALLEAMQEHQVTVGQKTYPLPDPFFVIATQNPIEQEGTYPLPEAQLDRFMFQINIEYPTADEEEKIITEVSRGPLPSLRKVLSARDLLTIQSIIEKIEASPYIVRYVARLVRASRPVDPKAPPIVKEMVDWGAGPRAGLYLILGGKALAAMDGRYTVSIQDIHEVAVPVLRHRIVANFRAQAEGIDSVAIIKRLIETVPEPQIAKYV